MEKKSGSFKIALPYYFGGLMLCVLVIWGIIGLFNNYIIIPNNKKRIKENPFVVNGAMITGINNINKVSDAYSFTFSYYIDKKMFINKHTIGLELKSNSVYNVTNYLMEKRLPVIYENGNPKNSRLLIAPKDFEYFEIQFPDSLKWIKDDVLD